MEARNTCSGVGSRWDSKIPTSRNKTGEMGHPREGRDVSWRFRAEVETPIVQGKRRIIGGGLLRQFRDEAGAQCGIGQALQVYPENNRVQKFGILPGIVQDGKCGFEAGFYVNKSGSPQGVGGGFRIGKNPGLAEAGKEACEWWSRGKAIHAGAKFQQIWSTAALSMKPS